MAQSLPENSQPRNPGHRAVCRNPAVLPRASRVSLLPMTSPTTQLASARRPYPSGSELWECIIS
ncbi:hypothetical protein GY45DRAFT_1329849 [Cubamyces sp. BRFM 1775]|nr:hypothetical protein GY45DRAFT_1329849 [Cubamyces sp. BRFM 1775]